MDPDVNLAEQRTLASQGLRGDLTTLEMVRLSELILALDNWLTQGGLLPTDWSAHR